MQILVVGNGAREHALAYSLSLDPTVTDIHIAPGNAGMAGVGTLHPEVNQTDSGQVLALANELKPDLVVVGPEGPLVAGVGDALRAAGFPVFGPNADAARIEGSKAFAKDVMEAAGVKTARAVSVEPVDGRSEADTCAAVDAVMAEFGPTFVVKDDGLAGGKGVVVTADPDAARQHALDVLALGHPVLFESFLDGPEVSLFCLVDGETVVPLLPAQDHKRVGEGDTGPNTGGMGAYCPLPWLPADATEHIVREVCEPVAREMAARGCAFSGLLYAGLAWGAEGPAVVEFNCRFGDPETQAVLSLLKTPLASALYATATGTLAQLPPLEWEDGFALTVVLAAEGYPASPITGAVITGADPGSEARGIRSAGTALNADGQLVSAGGRVLNVVATGATLEQARDRAYEVLGEISMPGGHFRRDIALPAVEGRITLPA